MSYSNLLLYLLFGGIIVTLIDTLGAILSRRFQFKYRYLSVLSLTLYATMGFLVFKQFSLVVAITINGLLGFYDGTIGFWLSIKLRANNDLSTEEATKLLGIRSAISMIAIAILMCFIGYGLTFM